MYDNIKAAWRVLRDDNMPAQIRSYEGFEEACAALTTEQMDTAEAALAGIRRVGDETDLDSPLWILCAGEGAEELAAELDPSGRLNAVLEELFEHV